MKKQMKTMILLLLGLILALSGCAAPAGDLMSNVKAAEWPQSPSEPDTQFVGSVSEFSWNLLRESAGNKGNVLVSPASVYLALSMALNGSDKETREAMLAALSAKNLTLEDLDSACRDWMTLLMNTREGTKLSIANSIWYREGFDADPDFLQRNANFFNAAARALDFGKKSAVTTINDWVKKATAGTIEKIVEDIKPDVVMYLINAVYFKADWKTKFEAAKTVSGTFTAPAGEVNVKYMNMLEKIAYLEDTSCTGVLMPYKDERFAFVALLPAEGSDPRKLINTLTASQLAEILKNRKDYSIDLRLPKFTTRYDDSLLNELDSLGMGIAFDPIRANFSLMRKSRQNNLYISEVKHKTFCRVDELGTEAAAVTSVEVSETSMPMSDKQISFDRPFIYGIVDTITGLPLFLGIMDNPAAE